MIEESMLRNLVVRSPQDILQTLCEQFINPVDDVPSAQLVTISNGNQSWSGYPIRIDNRKNQDFLLMYLDSTRGPDATLYVAVSQISSIVVHNLTASQPIFFAPGSVQPLPTELPSKIDIKKQAVAAFGDLANKGWGNVSVNLNWNSLDQDPGAIQSVYKVVRSLSASLGPLTEDADYLEVFKKINEVEIKACAGGDLEMIASPTKLTFAVGSQFSNPRVGQLIVDKLKSSI